MGAYTIVVPDTQILSRVCGTNDCNLKLIEEFLGTQIFARGNELSIETKSDTDSAQIEQQFRFIINRILDEISVVENAAADTELVQAVLNNQSFNSQSHNFFSRLSISVPGGIRKVYARTKGQSALIQSIRKHDLVFACGPAGCGKTFLAVCEALNLLLTHKVSSIILTRPVVEAGESLGFLPGDLEDKINPYMRPLYDAMNLILPKDTIRKMCENGIIEVAPLAYMRGRTLNNACVILDEAQNTTVEQMKMFLTRMGENSKMFVTGDVTQIDLPKKISSGLVNALEILGGIPEIGIVHLDSDDVVRNEIVKKIIQAYEEEQNK